MNYLESLETLTKDEQEELEFIIENLDNLEALKDLIRTQAECRRDDAKDKNEHLQKERENQHDNNHTEEWERVRENHHTPSEDSIIKVEEKICGQTR